MVAPPVAKKSILKTESKKQFESTSNPETSQRSFLSSDNDEEKV